MSNTTTTTQNITARSAGPATLAETQRLLEAFCATNTTCLIVGPPGCGKTALISAFSEAHGMGEPIVLIGSQMDPTDVVGLPYADGDKTVYLAPVWQQQLLDDRPHLLFLDEFSNTSRSVQAALLKLIGERRFANGVKLPDQVMIVAAMNPRSSAVDYNDLRDPVINRMALISLEPSCEEFLTGFVDGWPNATPEPLADSAEWSAWTSRIARFLRQSPQWFLEAPELHASRTTDSQVETLSLGSESERYVVESAWATPRSWEAARRALVALGATKDLDGVSLRALRGIVGYRATAALAYFCSQESALDPFDAICNPAGCDWGNMTLNEAQELAGAIEGVAEICDGKDGHPTPEQLLEFLLCCAGRGATPTPAAAVHFAPKMAGTSNLRKSLDKIRPDIISAIDWRLRVIDVYEAYLCADSIATQGTLDLMSA